MFVSAKGARVLGIADRNDLPLSVSMRVGNVQAGTELRGRQSISVPMPGKIVAILVAEGDSVEKGQGLVIVEAMKMENEVRSPIAGEVKEIKVKTGETVDGGAVLLVVE